MATDCNNAESVYFKVYFSRGELSEFIHGARKMVDPKQLRLKPTAEPILQIQKALFRSVAVKAAGDARSVPWISAYMEQINFDAARGNLRAVQEQHALLVYLDKKGALTPPEPIPPMTPFEKRVADHEMATKVAMSLEISMIDLVRPYVQTQFEEAYGKIEGLEEILPDYLSRSSYETYRPVVRRKNVPGVQGDDPSVGYRRPPQAKRFQKGVSGNPAGRRKAQNDIWVSFRDTLSKTVPVTIDGVTTPRTTVYVALLQATALAMKGDHQARQLVKSAVMLLDGKGLLTAPEKRRRRTKKWTPEEYQDLLELIIKVMKQRLPDVEDALVSSCTAAYGPLPGYCRQCTWIPADAAAA